MSTRRTERCEVLVIGSGVFGASLAYELARGSYAGRGSDIIVLDRELGGPASDAASYDINKVVRQDYSDKLYSKLAKEAIDAWKTPEWSPFYHETGMVIYAKAEVGSTGNGFVSEAIERQNELQAGATPLATASELHSRFPAAVPLGDFSGYKGYYNPRGGWAEAAAATRAMAKRAAEAGCRFIQGDAIRLKTSARLLRTVIGVELDDGRSIEASFRTVVAAGSWSPMLVPDLGKRGLCEASGQYVAMIQLSPEEAAGYKSMPIPMNLNNEFYMFPPNADNIVKFAIHGCGYSNYSPEVGEGVSIPRTKRSTGNIWEGIPRENLGELREALRAIYPALAAKTFFDSRLCWYSDARDGHFVVGPHPTLQKLHLCTGGSGHGFKFLPTLGRYLCASLEDKLDPELAQAWSPARPAVGEDPARPAKEARRKALLPERLVRSRDDYKL